MSSETRPISPRSFAQAIEDLPLENIYGKAYEINNSIAHLRQSNKVLQEYSDSIKDDTSLDASVRTSGDKDCLEAIQENEVVIDRQRERVRLLKAEVERRGQLWHEADPDKLDGMDSDLQTGSAQVSSSNGATSTLQTQQQTSGVSGRLTDEELRRQVESMLPEENEDDGSEGMHL